MLSNNNYQLATCTSEIAGGVPRDVWLVTAKFINTFQATHRFRATCKLFHQLENEEETYRALLQKFFPDVYAKLCSDGFKNGWKELYIGTILKYCIDLTPAQLDDYSHIRRCDPVEIARILEQPNGLERIFISDMCGMTLWDYLRHPVHDQHRQTILDLIYAEVLARFCDNNTNDFATLYTREIDTMVKSFGQLGYLLCESPVPVPALLVFAVNCHQNECLSAWLKTDGHFPQILILVALYNNNLDAFNLFSADSRIKDNNAFWLDIIKLFLRITNHPVLSQPLADALFNKIQERSKFGLVFTGIECNLVGLAALLNQVTFFKEKCTAHDIKTLVNFESLLKLSIKHGGADLYKLLVSLGAPAVNNHDYDFQYIAKTNNLLLLKEMIAQIKPSPWRLQKMLESFSQYGDLNGVNLLLSENAEITPNVLYNTLDNFQLSSNPHIFRVFVNKLGNKGVHDLLFQLNSYRIYSPTLIRWLQTEFKYDFSQATTVYNRHGWCLTKAILVNVMHSLHSETSIGLAKALLSAGANVNLIRSVVMSNTFTGTALQFLINAMREISQQYEPNNKLSAFYDRKKLENGVRLFRLMLEHGADIDGILSGDKKTARDMIVDIKDGMLRDKLLTIIAEVKSMARDDVPKPGLRLG